MSKHLRDENSNEGGPSDGEKPLKKARFVWELKGKHHLKEAQKSTSVNNNNIEEDVPIELEVSTSSTAEQINNIDNTLNTENTEGNVNFLEAQGNSQGNSVKSFNHCCLQTLLEKTSDDIDNELDEISNEINFTMGTPNSKNQEYYLHKWQARQIARGFVDNTINSVLETWSNRPLDAAELVDNYANDDQVEDDAILMAIQSHGLQSTSSRLELPSSTVVQEGALERNPGIEEFTHDNLENVENERMKEQEAETHPTDDSSGFSGLNLTSSESLGTEETMDFLNAAVSVAIQKKGLSYGY